jgi:branched-chain amino acid transport system ATP-binding protein
MMPIEIQNLYVGYSEDIMILQGVSMMVRDNLITTVLGPNGVGKSTLLKTIFGFLRPKEGSIRFNGEDMTHLRPTEMLTRGISYVPQRRHVFPYLSVEENLKLSCWTFRKDKKSIQERIEGIFERYPQLKKKRKDQAIFMSGGEQRLLEIAKSLLTNPTFLLIDEPTAGLAPLITHHIYDELKRLQRDEKKTLLLVDQNIHKALGIADYVYVLDLGKNKIEGSIDDFGGEPIEMMRQMLF